MQKNCRLLIFLLLCLTTISGYVCAQSVPEEARSHMARGLTAVEMAKSPDEYDPAIREFQEAARLAPYWPDPQHDLGLVLEKSGKFREAVASLKEYLRLAPGAPDAASIKELVYKLEYKAEQILSVQEIVDILVSFSDEQSWQVTGNCTKYVLGFKYSDRDGWASVKSAFRLFKNPEDLYSDSKIIGSGLKYSFVANTCPPGEHQNDYDCFGEMINEVSVVSKTLVKIRQKTLRQDPNGFIPNGERTCVFQKK